MGAWNNWIGRTVTQHDRLTPALLQRFLATIDSAETGVIAPQAIHWVLCTPEAATAQLGIDGHPRRSDSADSFFPPVPHPRRMWASSTVEFVAPIEVDAGIERVSSIAAITEKTGSTGSLVFVDVDHQTRANGVLAVRETQTLVYREAATIDRSSRAKSRDATPKNDSSTALDANGPNLADWHFHRTVTPNEALLFRFSAITFNTHRIHYDAHYAIHEEGYRGLVVHGPLMSSLLIDLAARQFGANALRTYAFRAQSPAFVNEPLHLAGRREGGTLTLAALGSDGRTCVAAEAQL
jgi:3-methylfumaryl-CoA hydratase